MMRSALQAAKSLCQRQQQQWVRFACSSSVSSPSSPSPLYELRFYAMNAKDMKLATQMFENKFHLRMKHSKLVAHWNSEVGDGISQFVHIWEYENLSHRRHVRSVLAKDEQWNTEFVAVIAPCIAHWRNVLMIESPGSKMNLNFAKDPAAVYLLDQIKVADYKKASNQVETNSGEILVGNFFGILGPTKTEYRLWRYDNIDGATEGSVKRAMDAPFDGSTILMYPSKISPLS